jgi:ABC-type transport system involved in cytochrome bd biosynthesis fused ATPase/permease subunit
MQTASFTGFIRVLFYILAFYYIFKFLAKLLLPLLVKKVVQKAGENFQQQQNQGQDTAWKSGQANEDIRYSNANSKKPRETKKVGDYVDYEEID